MKKSSIFLIAINLFFNCFSQLSIAQKIVGFWAVNEVTVGEETMTPVAKWFKIEKDETYRAGNGWLQNGSGMWNYDKKNKKLQMIEHQGIEEGFGAFEVKLFGNKMIWKRLEEDMPVVVTLEKIDELPRSTADQLVGLWKLVKATDIKTNKTQVNEAGGKDFLFLRWDRMIISRNNSGERSTGVWHINAHKPEVTFINLQNEEDDQKWTISFNNDQLKLKGISNNNKSEELVYIRINKFPE